MHSLWLGQATSGWRVNFVPLKSCLKMASHNVLPMILPELEYCQDLYRFAVYRVTVMTQFLFRLMIASTPRSGADRTPHTASNIASV